MNSKPERRTRKTGDDEILLNITDASKYLRSSRNTIWRVIKRYKVMTFENPFDMRETLVTKSDLDRLKTILRPKESRRAAKDE